MLVLLAGLATLVLWVRRRVGPIGPVKVPEIERPRVPPEAPEQPGPTSEDDLTTELPLTPPLPEHPGPEASPGNAMAEALPPLRILIEPQELALTLMNASLTFRMTLTNDSDGSLTGIAVAGDLVGAHASIPREAQLAGLETELSPSGGLASLAPQESGEVTGELRLPLARLIPIARGQAVLFVPLARFRVTAEGQEPRCFTVTIGQPSPRGGGAIQPIRLDQGPRIYHGLTGRAF